MPLVPDRSASSSFSFDREAFRTTEQLVQTACTACEMASGDRGSVAAWRLDRTNT
jgi:hypothetical protein